MKSLKILLTVFVFCATAYSSKGQSSQNQASPRYTKVENGYVMALRQGDTLFSQLENFAIREKIPFAYFTGFGFMNITFGFFNNQTKEYTPKYFDNLEMSGINGSVAWQNGKPSLHIHGMGADKNFNAFGGHILSGTVSTGSLELFISVSNKKLERIKDEALGANVLEIK